jgi:hypothetical protein
VKVGLAPQYQLWMWLLSAGNLGGCCAAWVGFDSGAVTLRSHRKITWAATRAITVQDYTEATSPSRRQLQRPSPRAARRARSARSSVAPVVDLVSTPKPPTVISN